MYRTCKWYKVWVETRPFNISTYDDDKVDGPFLKSSKLLKVMMEESEAKISRQPPTYFIRAHHVEDGEREKKRKIERVREKESGQQSGGKATSRSSVFATRSLQCECTLPLRTADGIVFPCELWFFFWWGLIGISLKKKLGYNRPAEYFLKASHSSQLQLVTWNLVGMPIVIKFSKMNTLPITRSLIFWF